MVKKKVFVSFDYETDKHYKFLLQAWDSNPKFEFVFDDNSSQEVNSYNVGRIKAALTQKITSATHTLVIIGKEANKKHKDYLLIQERNWINWEIEKSNILGKKIVGIKLAKQFEPPENILNIGASWAFSFTEDTIIKALEDA